MAEHDPDAASSSTGSSAAAQAAAAAGGGAAGGGAGGGDGDRAAGSAAEVSSTPDALPVTAHKREAEEWLLVLRAEGLEASLRRSAAGFGVEVADPERTRAGATLAAYRLERRERQERVERARRNEGAIVREATLYEIACAYALALTLLAFHLGLEQSGRREALVQMGRSQAVLVLDGEPWRLVTALTLHADLPHVVGNTLFGGLFLAALAGRLGVGLALLCFVVSGTLGNLANALYYGSGHSSIGASTGVFGLVGVLAGLAAWQRHQRSIPGRGAWVAFAAGLGIVAILGSGGPGIDFTAHLFGLAAGGLTGLGLAVPLAPRARPGLALQALAFAAALSAIGLAWLRAASA